MKTKKGAAPPGAKIQQLRLQTGMTLAELARKCGLSEETISGIEEGHEIPPVAAILQISRVLGMDASGLLSQEDQRHRLKSKKESYDKRSRSYGYKTLSPGAAAMHLKAFLVSIDPRQDHEMVEYRHEGEEFIYVLRGALEVTVGENLHQLATGGSLHFNSFTPHKLRNPGADKTELIVVLYTP